MGKSRGFDESESRGVGELEDRRIEDLVVLLDVLMAPLLFYHVIPAQAGTHPNAKDCRHPWNMG